VVRAGQAAPERDAARDGLLRRGGADLGPTLRRRGDRDAARGARLTPDRERDPARVRAGVAVLLLLRGRERRSREAPLPVRPVLRPAARARRPRQLHRAAGARDRRLRLPQEPCHPRRRWPRREGRRDRPSNGPRLLAAWPRGDLVEGADGAPGPDLPDDPRPRDRRAGRGPLARLEHLRLQRVGGRQRRGSPPDPLRAREPRDRADRRAQPGLGRLDRERATSARPTWTWSCWPSTSGRCCSHRTW